MRNTSTQEYNKKRKILLRDMTYATWILKRLQELRSKPNRVFQDNTYRGNVIKQTTITIPHING